MLFPNFNIGLLGKILSFLYFCTGVSFIFTILYHKNSHSINTIPKCIWFYPFNKISNIEQVIMGTSNWGLSKILHKISMFDIQL